MATAKRDLTDPRVQGPRPAGRLLTIDEVAERLQVSVRYVRRYLIFEYRLPYVKLGPRKTRVAEQDLEEFLNVRRVTADDYPLTQADQKRAANGDGKKEESNWRTLSTFHPENGECGRTAFHFTIVGNGWLSLRPALTDRATL